MIGCLFGKIWSVEDDGCVLDVSGVGYELALTSVHAATLRPGQTVTLFTHAVYREDAQTLYGFQSAEQKVLFRLLITASGVGPKLALTIICFMSENELMDALLSKNVDAFKRIKGVGARVAEKLVMELSTKCQKLPMMATRKDTLFMAKPSAPVVNQTTEDVFLALEKLGYSRRVLESKVQAMYKQGMSTQELLRKTLAALSTPA